MMLSIRKADSSDLFLLNTLAFDIYREHFESLWISKEEMLQYLHSEYSIPVLRTSLINSDECWYIAEARYPVGFAKINWNNINIETNFRGVQLCKLYLTAGETGKHYGKRMFETILRYARERGQDCMWLEVLEQNERARMFYEKRGMRIIGEKIFSTPSQRSKIYFMGMII